MPTKAKGRRYRTIKKRCTLDDPLFLWFGNRLSHPKGDPKAFAPGDLVRVLKKGSTLWLYIREAL